MKQIHTMRCLPALLVLVGCDERQAAGSADLAERIECAVDGAQRFEPVCMLERVRGSRDSVLRSPRGGFRRIILTEAGVETADGAEPARVTRLGPDLIEVEIAGDRYRLPVRAGP